MSPSSLFSDKILPTDPNIRYVGRFDTTVPDEPKMYWSGSHIIAWFEGTSCQVKLASAGTDDFVNIIIDDGSPVKYNLASGLETIAAASGLSEGTHKIEVFKRTSHDTGSIILVGFITDDGKGLAELQPAPAVKIEFYGDGFTDGQSVDSLIFSDSPTHQNNYLTYAAITARNLGLEYVSIASQGIAVLYPRELGYIMDNYYVQTVPGDDSPSNAWDFSKYTPDIVVIYLIGNDAFVNPPPHTTTEQSDIIAACEGFLLKIRAEYPAAEIIWALDNWYSEPVVWPGYVESAVARMNTTHEDPKVNSFFFTNEASQFNNGDDPWALIASEHEEMAEELTSHIRDNLEYLFLDPLIGGTPLWDLTEWFRSEWFGDYNTTGAPWLFHAEHGFLYRYPESTNTSMYFYDHGMSAWWWTNSIIYPLIYRFSDGVWLWYQGVSSDLRWFYNFGTEGWESLSVDLNL